MRKPPTTKNSAVLSAKRKSLISSKIAPVAEAPVTDDPSLFSLEAEAKEFASKMDSEFQINLARMESVVPSIEVTEPRQRSIVGPPGAQGLPGQQGINGIGLPWVVVDSAGLDAWIALRDAGSLDPNTIYDLPVFP